MGGLSSQGDQHNNNNNNMGEVTAEVTAEVTLTRFLSLPEGGCLLTGGVEMLLQGRHGVSSDDIQAAINLVINLSTWPEGSRASP
ncbi:hypothetical protein EYF80_060253 [Liparis tanakae]|uniref:Uncharacterized protein n=1 Tax=Liparis tanakae TaxID=230148 RepID=A0A4Z2EKX0_9TELE|nr:hypothetical protein EYF80_060253 [Liparis tanakae]